MSRRRFLHQLGALSASRAASCVYTAGYICCATAATKQQSIAPLPGSVVTGVVTPRWMQGLQVNEWTAIKGTALGSIDCAPQAAAGLTDAQCHDIGFGDPRSGILAFSGGALKTDGSEMLVFGGGGAGAWGGNDVRGLRLEDDVPVWRTRIGPSRAANVPPRNTPPTPYMRDGTTPCSRHSYWSPQFIDAQDKLMVFGCVNTWNGDSGRFNVVDSVPIDKGVWDPPGTHPGMPDYRGWDGNWVCKHPATEDVYTSGASTISKWSRGTNTWSTLWKTERTDVDRAVAAIDPTGHGTLLRIGNFGAANVPLAIDLSTGLATVASFSGPHAASVNVGGQFAAGIAYDPGLGKFLVFQDDGYLYAISKVSMVNWNVDRLRLTGTPPQAGHSGPPGLVAIWGRMRYVPNLRGVCIIQAYDRAAYFVKTS